MLNANPSLLRRVSLCAWTIARQAGGQLLLAKLFQRCPCEISGSGSVEFSAAVLQLPQNKLHSNLAPVRCLLRLLAAIMRFFKKKNIGRANFNAHTLSLFIG